MRGPGWCEYDRMPASVCGGPHRQVRTTLGLEILRYDQKTSGSLDVPPLDATPPPLAETLDSLEGTLARHSRDWSADRADAWLWGVLVGWDCEEAHEHKPDCGDAMIEVAEQHRWDEHDVARLRGLRASIRAASTAGR